MLHYKDNAGGLGPAFLNDPYKILEPNVTDKKDEQGNEIGTGMGMWIIQKIVSEYRGSINLDENKPDKNQFIISVDFK